MRWPFRRKGTGSAPGSAASSATPGDPSVPMRRPNRQWATLPPLPITVDASAPLVIGPAPVLPPLPGTRLVFGPPIAAVAGQVAGLARAIPPVPEPQAHTDRSASAQLPQEPMVHRRVRSGPPAPSAPLTDAVGPYVGEAREPAEPHRAPGWMRYVPEWMQQSGPAMDLGSSTASPFSTPAPARPAPTPPRPILPPSRVIEVPEPAGQDVAQPASAVDSPVGSPAEPAGRPGRRPNLGQTRRLGLGAPIKQLPNQELVLLPETSPPARVEPEPVPVPPPSEPRTATVTAAEAAPLDEGGDDSADVEEPALPPPPPQPPPLRHRPPPVVRAETAAPVPDTPAPTATPVPRTAPSAVQLVYRSAPGKRDRPAAATRQGTAQVPSGLAAAIRGRHGVDVADVPVHRGPEVAAEARSLGARAFTKGGEVFLPEEAGSLDAPKARGLLAHELVHVVQQRTLGSSLPALSTSAGSALEAEAVAAEREHAGHEHAAAPLLHPALTQVIGQAARTVGVQLAPLVSEPMDFTTPPAPPPPPLPTTPSTSDETVLSEPVRQEIDVISEASAIRVVEQWTNPDLGGSGFSSGPTAQPFPGALPDGFPSSSDTDVERTSDRVPDPGTAEEALAHQILQVINIDRTAKGQPILTSLDEYTMDQVRRAVAEQNAASSGRTMMLGSATAPEGVSPSPTEPGAVRDGDQSAGPSMEPATAQDTEASRAMPADGAVAAEPYTRDRPLDLDAVDLDDLCARLYDRLRSRLRLELLIDRERAGLLTDFR